MINDIEERIKEYSELINKYPDKKELYIERAKLYDLQGKYKKAVEDLKKTLSGYYVCRDIITVCEEIGLIKEAEEFYTKEINKDKKNISAYFDRLYFYMQTKQIKQVLADCENILKLSSEDKIILTLKKILTK